DTEEEADANTLGTEPSFNISRLILQDQYLQSAWKTNSSILPWTLDSSISEENRQTIESMLLEEHEQGSSMPSFLNLRLKRKLSSLYNV
uniref:Uncharacterized protein n=1 Tax=Cyprinus carpio carpio TaxID=630221 RepID=A0A9J7Z419_CYPCA